MTECAFDTGEIVIVTGNCGEPNHFFDIGESVIVLNDEISDGDALQWVDCQRIHTGVAASAMKQIVNVSDLSLPNYPAAQRFTEDG